jgi:hypothetical protein
MRFHVAVTLVALAAGCTFGGGGRGRRDPGPPDLGVRVWTMPLVHWDAGSPRAVALAIENGTDRTVRIAAPDPAYARVEVFAGPDSVRVCGAGPAEGARTAPAPAGVEVIELEPGDRASLEVDLGAACASVPPGSYRYEVAYRLPDVEGKGAISGTLPTRYGELVVAAGGESASGVGVAAQPGEAARGGTGSGDVAVPERPGAGRRPTPR